MTREWKTDMNTEHPAPKHADYLAKADIGAAEGG